MDHFQKYHNTLFVPPKFWFVSSLSWDHCKSQEKIKTMLMQNFEGQVKSIMVFLKVAYRWFPPDVIVAMLVHRTKEK